MAQNWNVGLFDIVPCDLPREVAKDGLVMSVGPDCGLAEPICGLSFSDSLAFSLI